MCTDHLTEMTGVGCPPAFLFNNTTLLGLFEIFFPRTTGRQDEKRVRVGGRKGVRERENMTVMTYHGE